MPQGGHGNLWSSIPGNRLLTGRASGTVLVPFAGDRTQQSSFVLVVHMGQKNPERLEGEPSMPAILHGMIVQAPPRTAGPDVLGVRGLTSFGTADVAVVSFTLLDSLVGMMDVPAVDTVSLAVLMDLFSSAIHELATSRITALVVGEKLGDVEVVDAFD